MGGQEALGPSQHRRRRTAGWLLAIGGSLLLAGIIALIVGTSMAVPLASHVPAAPLSSTTSMGSSWDDAMNLFGGTTAITGLIGALTGLLTLRSSRRQTPATVYVMAAQPPATPVGAATIPGPSKPQAVAADPAGADKTGKDSQAP